MNPKYSTFETTFLNPRRGACARETNVRSPKKRGLTLVEVMVATILLTMLMAGLLMALVQSYRLSAETRIRNEVRFALRSMADQFLLNSIPYTAAAELVANPPTPLFKFAATPTGEGLSWRKDLNVFTVKPTTADSDVYINGTSSGLTVPMGAASGAPINVVFTRSVIRISPSTGTEMTPDLANSPAGFLLRADFSARFTILGRPLTQSITVLRSVP
ncbi:type IV pilus modification PilV family protein [Rariglobus hedericola]|nr:prepilin-type N-terminal cleavage/methylation domain-containing protein [Rariglobus hedericola]